MGAVLYIYIYNCIKPAFSIYDYIPQSAQLVLTQNVTDKKKINNNNIKKGEYCIYILFEGRPMGKYYELNDLRPRFYFMKRSTDHHCYIFLGSAFRFFKNISHKF